MGRNPKYGYAYSLDPEGLDELRKAFEELAQGRWERQRDENTREDWSMKDLLECDCSGCRSEIQRREFANHLRKDENGSYINIPKYGTDHRDWTGGYDKSSPINVYVFEAIEFEETIDDAF